MLSTENVVLREENDGLIASQAKKGEHFFLQSSCMFVRTPLSARKHVCRSHLATCFTLSVYCS